MNTENSEDGSFTEAKKEIEGHGFALMTTDTLPRHMLMKDASNEGREREIESLQLDVELGLETQFKEDARKFYNKDVDELVDAQFPEVTKDILADIFNIKKLQAMCNLKNAKTIMKLFVPNLLPPLAMFALCLLSIPFLGETFWNSADVQVLSGYQIMGNTLVIGGMIVGLVGAILSVAWFFFFFRESEVETVSSVDRYGDRTTVKTTVRENLRWEHLKAELVFEEIKNAGIEIPYGAKLRLKEAMDTKIFDTFMVVHPHVDVKNIEFKKTKVVKVPEYTDPAIVGIINLDKGKTRMFLVTLWDVAKDVEKAIKKIKNLSDFKVPQHLVS